MKSPLFIEEIRQHLLERKKTKQKILNEGGEQSLSHSQNDILRINFALKRLESGQYGLCTDCGIPIDKKRLSTIPETPFCIDCAEKLERRTH